MERLAVFVPSLPHPLLSTVYQCDGCLSYLGRGGSWLSCQVWPAISVVSILELVANSGSSRMSRAPNLHSLRATKLFNSSCMVEHLEGISWVAIQILYIKTEQTLNKWGLFTLLLREGIVRNMCQYYGGCS